MKFLKVMLRPGVFRDPTAFSLEGGWYDSDKVRFRGGFPETIGGWLKFVTTSYLGIGRSLHDWITVSSSKYLAIGSTYKLYISEGAAMNDVTDIRRTAALGSNPLSSASGSGILTVTDASHGAVDGDFVTFTGATTFAGIPSGNLNIEHRINSTPSSNTYTILVATAATSATSGGGTAAVAAYQENIGLDTYSSGAGWGVGVWGSGTWGGVRAVDAAGQLRLWSMDNFGDDLLATIRGGRVCYWDESNGIAARALKLTELTRLIRTLDENPVATTNLSTTITITDDSGHDLGVGDEVTLAGAPLTNGVPASEINTSHTVVTTPTETTFTVTVATAATSTGSAGGSVVVVTYVAGDYYAPIDSLNVLVSDQDRHAICLGVNPIGSTVIDPLLIRWCTSENATVWRPKLENLAGGQRLSSGSTIMTSVKTRQEIVVWTDTGLHSMVYVGAPYVYSFSELATDVSIISPNAWGAAGDSLYFMARGGFYVYSGAVKNLRSPVESYVFSDVDFTQQHKIVCGTNADHGEVTWFYPSLTDNTGEVSRYVTYSHREDLWYFGTMARAYWTDAPTKSSPLASTITGGDAAANPIATTNTSGSIVATYASHGMTTGDEVIVIGSSAVGGIPTGAINTIHTVTAYTNDTFTFVVANVATSTVAAGGGVSVSMKFPQYVYSHETGYSADGVAINAYIESSDMDIEDGDYVWFMDKIIPDIKYIGASGGTDTVTLSIKGKDYPGDTLATIATAGIVATTSQSDIRGRARTIRLRAESSASGFGWRLGATRIRGKPDGRRT